MKVFYLYVSARQKNELLYQKGDYPDTLFYGLHYLRKTGHEVSYSDKAFRRSNLLRYLLYPIEYLFVLASGYGFKLDQAILLLRELNSNDIIVACGISVALPLGLLRAIGILRKPVICIQMGGGEKILNPLIVRSYRFLYSHLDKIVFFSLSEQNLVVDKFKLDSNKVSFIPLGIDTNFFKPKKIKKGKCFLSVGKDVGRDFKLVISAFKDTNLSLKIVTSRANMACLEIPPNVEVVYDVPYLKLRELYNESQGVILMMQPLQRAGGQLVFLEALAMGKPIIVTNAAGLLSGYEDLRRIVSVVDYGDKEGLINQIHNLDFKSASIGRKIVENHYSSQILGNNLADLVSRYEK